MDLTLRGCKVTAQDESWQPAVSGRPNRSCKPWQAPRRRTDAHRLRMASYALSPPRATARP